MKSLTVSSNGRGVSREQNKISHGCAEPSSPPARPENNMDVNYGDDGDVYLTQPKVDIFGREAFVDPVIDKTLCI